MPNVVNVQKNIRENTLFPVNIYSGSCGNVVYENGIPSHFLHNGIKLARCQITPHGGNVTKPSTKAKGRKDST